ncbi:MAG TPA: histidinol dehydrogenase [Candidatus Limnocylindrales bacterium]|nr:histidinol dehydrogenase [Candidatus Limnocylindrales bacterium]
MKAGAPGAGGGARVLRGRVAARGRTAAGGARSDAASATVAVLRDGTRQAQAQLARLAQRGRGPAGVEARVLAILEEVRRDGDAALARLTRQLDGVDLRKSGFEVSRREIDAAAARVEPSLLRALEKAHARIRAFHRNERERGFDRREDGIRTGIRITPLAHAGVYVPGGKAAYPSSVLMNIVPAKVAGVPEITVVTPPSRDGIRDEVLAAARIAGATRVLRIGGAQAVAALAYGTQSIARVDKIVGPGNIWVATAKRLVFGEVDIDMVAGPSEVLIVADDSADPEWVAADMLAQAEHDELAASICITTSPEHGARVAEALARQCQELPRAHIAAKSLTQYGTILVAADLDRACALANQIAPEHLQVFTRRARTLVPKLTNAGAIFVGALTTEPLGDYAAGPNHVLPTGGSARFASPLGVYDFVKRTSIIEVDRRGFARLEGVVTALARAEGLDAHAAAVTRRKPKRPQ